MATKPEVKEGYKTTEFWVTMLAMAGIAFGIPVDPGTAAMAIGFLGSIYTGIRGYVKARS